MQQAAASCFKVSDKAVQCPCCKGFLVIKNGFTATKKQQYCCKTCNKRFLEYYTYHAYQSNINNDIISLTKEGLGIRSTARFLKISATTLLKRIIAIAGNITVPPIPFGKTYEVDEIRTFTKCRQKLIWIVYALERKTKAVVDFNVGARTNKTLNRVKNTATVQSKEHIHRRTEKLQVSDRCKNT